MRTATTAPEAVSVTDVVEYAHRRARAAGATLTNPEAAWGHCVIETGPLVAECHGVHAVRATGQTYPGREHWAAVVWDDDTDPADLTVVDLTLRQFLPDAPVPWIGPLVDWYDLVCDGLGDWIHVEFRAPDPSTIEGFALEPHWAESYARDDEPPVQPPNPWKETP